MSRQNSRSAAETRAKQHAGPEAGSDLEADLKALCTLGRVFLQGILQHSLKGLTLAVGVVAQEAENGIEIIHTVLDGCATQAPPSACLQFHGKHCTAIVSKHGEA